MAGLHSVLIFKWNLAMRYTSQKWNLQNCFWSESIFQQCGARGQVARGRLKESSGSLKEKIWTDAFHTEQRLKGAVFSSGPNKYPLHAEPRETSQKGSFGDNQMPRGKKKRKSSSSWIVGPEESLLQMHTSFYRLWVVNLRLSTLNLCWNISVDSASQKQVWLTSFSRMLFNKQLEVTRQKRNNNHQTSHRTGQTCTDFRYWNYQILIWFFSSVIIMFAETNGKQESVYMPRMRNYAEI